MDEYGYEIRFKAKTEKEADKVYKWLEKNEVRIVKQAKKGK
jgi:hypothetical protein